jgi:energy-coupling factor transporter ATP-binding protein EcfA2
MNDLSGSRWRKWDLHFHTPCSFDYEDKSQTPAQIVKSLTDAGIEVVAVTDHHKLDEDFIKEMQGEGAGRITVLPGIELTCPLGGREGVHFIGIFPEGANLASLSRELLTRTGIASEREKGTKEEQLFVDFEASAQLIRDLGGLVSIHGHGKASSIECIANNEAFKLKYKKEILRDHVDLLEIGKKEREFDYQKIVFPAIGFVLPIVIGSDNHDARAYDREAGCWIKADPTFAGLKMALREPDTRFCRELVPPDLARYKAKPTRYMKSIEFVKLTTMPGGDEWFSGSVPLNPGLVAIIGNKGSGKSALSDCLGLLGSCGTSKTFSFLSPERFLSRKSGRADHVQATLHWLDGEPQVRRLSQPVAAEDAERVKYLPQNFVETVCNELAMPGGGSFEQELKKVIFAKLSLAEQLGCRTLDELTQLRTGELQKEAVSLAVGLNALAMKLGGLEERKEPAIRRGIQNRITQLNEQIESHKKNNPGAPVAPAEDPTQTAAAKLQLERVEKLRAEQAEAVKQIAALEAVVVQEQRRAATASRLLEKLAGIEAEFNRRLQDLQADALSLGLTAANLAKLTLDRAAVTAVQADAEEKRAAARQQVDGPLPDGLKAKKLGIEGQITAAQSLLEAPAKKFQQERDRYAAWEQALTQLVGNSEIADSLKGQEAELKALDLLEGQIAEVQAALEALCQKIHATKLAEAAVFTQLYGPIQQFISEQTSTTENLRLEFKAEVVEEGFVENLLSHINQTKVGSFSGVDEGRQKGGSLVAPVDWASWNSVKQFLESVVDALRFDRRPGSGATVSAKSQVGKGKTVADLYSWLYGGSYMKPRYLLKWDGKDVEQLSPGERGTLLLVFYLLIDDSDVPLIIDQPEANLDNATVAQKLVDCIRAARNRRQVLIVTHNPNLAVVCDADQIIHAEIDKTKGNKVTYETGALEHPKMSKFAIDVLEGGRLPFDKRDETYCVSGD